MLNTCLTLLGIVVTAGISIWIFYKTYQHLKVTAVLNAYKKRTGPAGLVEAEIIGLSDKEKKILLKRIQNKYSDDPIFRMSFDEIITECKAQQINAADRIRGS